VNIQGSDEISKPRGGRVGGFVDDNRDRPGMERGAPLIENYFSMWKT
jgi:hypothetical protein